MNNLSLKVKILLLSGFMTLVAACIGTVSFFYAQKTTTSFTNVIGQDVPALRAVGNMLLHVRMARIELLQLSVPGTPPEADLESQKIINESWAKYDQDLKDYEKVSANASAEEKTIYAGLRKSFDVVREDFKKALELYKKNPDENSKERKEMMQVVTIVLEQHGAAMRDATRQMEDLQAKQIQESSDSALKAAQTGTTITILTTLLGSLIGFALAFLFSTKLARQIGSIIDSISNSSDEVASTSQQIASSSEQLSQATTQQAASLEETAASLEEISAMVSKASESAATTEQSSADSQTKAEEGRKAVEQMMTSMDEISQSNEAIMDQVNHSNQQMTEIVRVIQEIGNKTKVINEIVFQTKLLSFNASVEAARAGEHGKGFAVVAEEVGNLAQMSGNAAKEISEMLDSSITKVESIVHESKSKVENLVNSGKQKVESGVEIARQCSSVLEEIVTNVSRVTGLAQEISQASKEQAQGVGEINKAMNQLDSVTQQNSATSQQAAGSAEELSAQATSLKASIENLATAVNGGNSKPSSGPSSRVASKHVPKETRSHKTSNRKTSNIVPFKNKKPAADKPEPQYKAVSGDSAPDRDSDGFGDT